MGAGQPNWQKLHEQGKLPKEARGKIALLGENDKLDERVKEIEAGVCDDCRAKLFPKAEAEAEPVNATVELNCPVGGCDFVAGGRTDGIARNTLRMHSKKHEPKP